MDKKQQILHHYRVDEDGFREISRKVGVGRKSLRELKIEEITIEKIIKMTTCASKSFKE